MIGLYRPQTSGAYLDVASRSGVGVASLTRLGFGCIFADLDLDGALDLIVANGHIDETVRNIRGNVGYAQAPLLFLNQGNATFRDVAGLVGSAFAQARVGRGLAAGDFDRDGDVDLLMTTNNGPAVLFRNDQSSGNRSLRFKLIGTQSNRDAIGATIRLFHGGTSQSRVVRSGSSYLSQSELPVTFGVGKRDVIDRVTISWPNGRSEEFSKVAAGKQYDCVEGKGISETSR
jgi:enediyne biosynthesis protein E4